MRAISIFVFAALCAAVAHSEYMEYPNELTRAMSHIPAGDGIGRFYANLQVPPEPKEQSTQMLMYFAGALGSMNVKTLWPVKSGVALIWNAKHRWIASAGSEMCEPNGNNCVFVSEDGADLKVEPGDMVLLNMTNVPKRKSLGYEVSVPSKGLTTGFRTRDMILQRDITHVFASVNTGNLTRREQFPTGETRMLKTVFTTAAHPQQEMPLVWSLRPATMWGQEFKQQGELLIFNWQ